MHPSDPQDPKKKLTPLPGAKLPPSPSQAGTKPAPESPLPNDLAQEIEKLAQAETNTLTVLAQGIHTLAEAGEVQVALLQDIRDLLVKACTQAGMPIPARLQVAKDKGEYDPDELDDDDEDDDEGGTPAPKI